MSTSAHPRIAIIGGGPGGLALLRTLHFRGIPATLYERELSLTSRAHLGGSLDLKYDSGQRAFRDNGLEDDFKRHSRPEGDEYKICGADGATLLSRTGAGTGNSPESVRPEIDRVDIRRILVGAVPAESIKWGHALVAVRPLGGGDGTQHVLEFANGHTATCDVLVGAEGAHSRVRELVSGVQPAYAGVTGAEVSLAPEVAASAAGAELSAFVGHGTVMGAERDRAMILQRNSDGRIRTYALHRAPEDWTLPTEPAAARAALLEVFADWSPFMKRFIELCDEAAIYPRPMYHLPVGHRWAHVRGVTLVGDAAHLITPFAGEGANLALLDGLELGVELAEAVSAGKGVDGREAAVAAWEERMTERAAGMAAITLENMNAFLNPNAPATLLEKVKVWFAVREGDGTA